MENNLPDHTSVEEVMELKIEFPCIIYSGFTKTGTLICTSGW